MGRYIVWEDLVGKYKSVGKDFDASLANSNWIPAAEGEVDGYVGGIYSVPFTPVPYVIRDLAIDICYYKMTYTEQNQDKLYKYIQDRIEAINNRTLVLTSSGVSFEALPLVSLSTSGFPSSFGMDDATNYRVSSSWQQQYASDRGDFRQ